MRKWMIPGLMLTVALSMGMAVPTNAMTQAEEKAAYETLEEKKMSLFAVNITIPASGSLLCENGNTLDFTFVNGVLTLSGAGDKLSEQEVIPGTTVKYRDYFNYNDTITSVVFTDDCKLTSMSNMFRYCHNLSSVTNIPDTVTVMDHAFDSTALTEIPELPPNLTSMEFAFAWCNGITTANIVINNSEEKDTLSYSCMFAGCQNLKTVTIDATGLNAEARIWTYGLCSECPSLESFELKNIPENSKNPGAYACGQMFSGCVSLKTVKNEGYFMFTITEMFKDCSQLTTIETKGFSGLSSDDSLEKAFKDCRALKGTYYISFSPVAGMYHSKDLSNVKERVSQSFAGCTADATFYLGYEPLVTYLNQIKVAEGETHSDANILYWKEGDTYVAPQARPGTSTSPDKAETTKQETKQEIKQETKKKISTLKLKKYKKGTKKVTGKTIKKAKVVIKIGNKKYTVKADKKGNFKATLKKKLKKKDKIKVTVSKSGYKTLTKTFKVK